MKVPNKTLTKVVSGVVATSVVSTNVLVSCTNFLYEDMRLVNAELPDKGLSAIDIDFSKDDIDYLNFLDKLGNDIIEHPIIAKEFVKNPQLFVEQYGYYNKVDIEENLLKLILTLGDDDINSAMRVGDVKLTLMLMKEKGLLTADSYTKINISEEQKNQILALIGVDEANFDQYGACTVAVVCIAYLFVGVISMAAAVYTTAVSVNVVAAVVAALGALLAVEVEVYGYVNDLNNSNFLDNNTPLKIWGLKGDTKNTFIAVDMYLEEEVDNIIELLESTDKNVFEKGISKSQLKNVIKLNLVKQH
jgi:hypothetical protein